MLYVVATPIGNLEDITLRALRILKEVDLVAAEDTRATQHLLSYYKISKPTVSCFEGNEVARADELVEKLREGKNIAMVSEAGLPGVSDPGQRIVARAIAEGVRVEVIPGASAALTALVGSGLPSDEFHFVGFLPRAEGERQSAIGELRALAATLIFYEAPGRTAATLRDLADSFGDRNACVARELTKIHEEFARAPLGQLASKYEAEPPRGEVTIVVAGAGEEIIAEIDIEKEIMNRLSKGQSAKEIAAALALQTGKPRRAIYQLVLAHKK